MKPFNVTNPKYYINLPVCTFDCDPVGTFTGEFYFVGDGKAPRSVRGTFSWLCNFQIPISVLRCGCESASGRVWCLFDCGAEK
jgi:hypothetical protein